MIPVIFTFLLLDIQDRLASKDRIYFCESLEQLLLKTLEEIVKSREKYLPDFKIILSPLRLTIKK